MSVFTTPEPVSATVEVAGAQVRVTASDRTDTAVHVEPADPANRSHVKVAEKTKVAFADGRLSVKTTTSGEKDGSVVITIDLPTGSGLAAYLAYSTVRADGSFGDCELHQASGRVRLERVGALRASVSSGEVVVGHITGGATLDGAAFEARIGTIDGAIEVSSSGGRIDIDRADGDVTVETAGGAIRIGCLTNGRAKLRNASGDIEVGVDEGAAVSTDVSSERGVVHNFVVPQGEPDATAARVSVHARTRRGDITVRRAAAQAASVVSTR
ncbi:DUF4097 family beta strand repeat-containing protein [Amycolatopsis sp. CA-230715]|uniref:DUF4097 family beta strand repeat-containing protein n=1 Tax=Amycolatopsis sp. CA-230715 TaxID=2745196 RepID=UPI001C015DC3|nr:DUF4097 family beta strand repeat-containing protein [Amycolatopsis sp. CA-230715]QWF78949.1 hypothetical protein HUW46_02349 [Amycolatopsis sp. CA-230715]